ncbi:hypothetical protein GOP56_19855 [Brevibacillus sp. 7WMA2]|uniref:Uncharacterized protein n=1 Tax=Brevibacillus laterosporus LMG 15441 TaxID=1042163 RepID=A0A075R123_BRELA|nr:MULTISPECIES: hypothetical protein [Brevibacillus]HAS01190.1 hypothetical protein [Brevibacillus sp.]AIG25161.1 hypothetical protein BRLA_c008200 [Brevibacillus laterosporus LMG 15441]AUM63760.1 hypothetical protein C0R09_04105 [Brevibacillus laterosporus]AYK06748.1 hypothetical protein D8Z77_10475 [Brevibacillus laterosporus]ERM20382.1 hypothetical protein P615_00315 [Brevibacillus laterosporus PE36]
MEIQEQIFAYVIWKEAGKYLKRDTELLINSSLKLGMAYGHLLSFLCEVAYGMEKAVAKDLRKIDVRMLAIEEDRGETFVLWKHRGENRLMRIPFARIKRQIQEKMEDMIESLHKRTEKL